MSVDINLSARDGISSVLDRITQSANNLNDSLDNIGNGSMRMGDMMQGAFRGASKNAGLLGKAFTSAGTSLTNKITKPVIATTTALAGLTLAKGFSRLKDLDNARAKLEAMHVTGKELSSVMDSAKEAVVGTAYGFNESATVAASATAAGVKSGKSLTKYLTSVSDVAAAAGTSYSEMGQIFNKIQAGGKVTAEEWNQLTDRGVNIQGALAKQLGVSKEEVLDLRQAGKITSKDFLAAMEAMYGGAAKSIGESTISGSIANIGAAISRIGMNFLGTTDDASSFAGRLLPLLKSVQGALGMIEQKASDLGSAFGNAIGPAMEKLTNFFNGIADGSIKIDAAKAKMGALAAVAVTALGPALKVVGKGFLFWDKYGGKIKAIIPVISKMGPQVLRIAGPIGLVVGLLAAMWSKSEAFRNSVSTLFSAVWDAMQPLLSTLGTMLSSLFDSLGTVMGALGDALAPIISAITPVIAAIVGIAGKIISAFAPAFTVIAKVAQWLAEKIGPAAQTAANIIQSAMGAAKGVIDGVASAIEAVKSAWDSIKSGVKTLAVRFTSSGSPGGGTGASHGGGSSTGGGHKATGGTVAHGGSTLVGERGPELVDLPKGASVHTARETKDMFGKSVVVNMNNNISNKGMSIEEVISQLSEKVAEAMSASAEGAVG